MSASVERSMPVRSTIPVWVRPLVLRHRRQDRELARRCRRFVKDPNAVVRVGDRVKVRVLGVDLARKRISLSRRSVETA